MRPCMTSLNLSSRVTDRNKTRELHNMYVLRKYKICMDMCIGQYWLLTNHSQEVKMCSILSKRY